MKEEKKKYEFGKMKENVCQEKEDINGFFRFFLGNIIQFWVDERGFIFCFRANVILFSIWLLVTHKSISFRFLWHTFYVWWCHRNDDADDDWFDAVRRAWMEKVKMMNIISQNTVVTHKNLSNVMEFTFYWEENHRREK